MSGKIGVGVITCDRPIFLYECLKSVPECYDHLVVVNDGKRSIKNLVTKPRSTVIEHEENRGVGITKNDALRFLMKNGCEHLFLIEEDMAVRDPAVFDRYIRAAGVSGIQHFYFAPGRPLNRKQDQKTLKEKLLIDLEAEPDPVLVCDYGSDVRVSLYRYPSGSFTYYSRIALERAGLHDENFYNACEHVELTYRIIKAGLHPPFWYFADVYRSHELIENQSAFEENRSIAPDRETWELFIERGEEYHFLKHGCASHGHPDPGMSECLRVLKELRQKFGSVQTGDPGPFRILEE